MLKFVSTQKLYEKIVKNEIKKEFVVPAFNLRTLTFETACALFRAAQKERVGAFIIELARSEMTYTNQSLFQYKNAILKAAKKEKFKGPVFLQVDHFFYAKNKNEKRDLRNLIKKAIKNGFYNIDLDYSTLSLKNNYILTADFTKFIRKIEPAAGLTVSIGAEVGEIGGKNTTVKEFQEFMDGYEKNLSPLGNLKGIIKIAIQSGTAHGKGGKVDFELLKKVGQKAKEYGLAGVAQHGASMLTKKEFSKFLGIGVCEIHLATIFQDIVYDSKYFPQSLKEKIYCWLWENYGHQKTKKETKQEFFHRLRKIALGPFKKEILAMPKKNIKKICQELEKRFIFFFRTLNVSKTSDLVKNLYSDQD